MMSHRGAEGEKIVAQIPMGEVTTNLADCIDMKNYVIFGKSDLAKIKNAIDYAKTEKQSVSILLKRPLWREKK